MSIFIGIDVSKETLDVACPCGSYYCKVANSPLGHQALHQWLQTLPAIAQVALEASGRYGEQVAQFLVQQGYAVSYLNPKQIHNFAQIKLHYNKTDKQDAKLIAEYCKLFQPPLYYPQSELRNVLKQRSRRIKQLQDMQQQEVNRSKSGLTDDFTLQQINLNIAHFDTLIRHTQQAVHDLILGDETLSQQYNLLLSIKGIGERTASLFLAEIDIYNFNSARQLAAYIGITPKQFQSGTSVNKRTSISKQGNAHLRAALYMPAVVAKRWNPPCRSFAQRLQSKGKHAMVIVIAVMRKLVHQIYGILKSGQPFDPNFGQIT